jgi:hypothetical protein
LRAFSARTTARLRQSLPLRLALPILEPLLTENIDKEVRKDERTIDCAARALDAGHAPAAEAVQRLLAEARGIDREFLAQAANLPLRLEIPYARIEPLRRRRIACGLELAYRILAAWRGGGRLRELAPKAWLEHALQEILLLYCEETAELAWMVRASGPLAALRERAAGSLRQVMAMVAGELARDAAAAVHRPRLAAQ